MNETRTRRGFIAATAAASAALAGCSDDGGIDPEGIDTGERPARGDETAPVTVTVFEDFACPHCRRFNAQVAPTIVQQYVEPGDVRYLHADFPIPVDETWSYAVGGAARAVFEEAGNGAFWDFSTAVFALQGEYSYDAIESVAEEVAGVGETARTAAEDGTHREALDADRSLGEQWDVSGTPSVFVGAESVDPGPQSIRDAIDGRL